MKKKNDIALFVCSIAVALLGLYSVLAGLHRMPVQFACFSAFLAAQIGVRLFPRHEFVLGLLQWLFLLASFWFFVFPLK